MRDGFQLLVIQMFIVVWEIRKLSTDAQDELNITPALARQ
jgi:hypothetical protein